MKSITVNRENLKLRLKMYNYRFNETDDTITLYPTIFSPIKIIFEERNIKIQGYFLRTYFFNRLERSLFSSLIVILISLEIQGPNGSRVAFLMGMIVLFHSIFIIHLEIIKSSIYRWLEYSESTYKD